MNDSFENELTQFRRARRTGLLLGGLLFIVVGLFFFFWLFGLGDFFFAWSSGVRIALLAVLGMGIAIGVGVALWLVFREGDTSLATRADDLTGSARREVSALQSLSAEEKGSDESLGAYLQEKLREEATQQMRGLSAAKRWPLSLLKKAGLAVLAVVVLVGASFVLHSEAARTVAGRILKPWEDRLPWSPLKFEVGPENPEVFYGGDVVLRVAITGGEIEEEVSCLVRRPSGKVSEFGVYADGGEGRFARSLEQVVEPLEVAFAVGKARSHWTQVSPLLRPQITGAKVVVTPPAYSGLGKKEFSLEGRELRVLAGSEIRL